MGDRGNQAPCRLEEPQAYSDGTRRSRRWRYWRLAGVVRLGGGAKRQVVTLPHCS
jgi:hypothetical protein